jgi:hypothetical protein
MRSNRISAIRIVAVNVLVLFIVANAAYWAIPVVSSVRDALKQWTPAPVDPRALLPNYADSPWAKDHFRELASLATKHMSFIGWRRQEFGGTTITVGGPYLQRRTVNNRADRDTTAYLFGGSTTWGTGSPDDQTIPSHFNAITGIQVENFGETAYVARQNLAMLVQLLEDGRRPNLVVFYDGVNEVLARCRRDASPSSYYLDGHFVAALERKYQIDDQTFAYLMRPVVSLAGDIRNALFPSSAASYTGYDCHEKPEKAAAIAENLVRDWAMAERLVEAHGGQFLAALQPLAYFSNTRLSHLSLPKDLEAQYKVVYPLIKQKLARSKRFHDLTAALDIDDFLYIDFCHVSPPGNKHIAARLAAIVLERDGP